MVLQDLIGVVLEVIRAQDGVDQHLGVTLVVKVLCQLDISIWLFMYQQINVDWLLEKVSVVDFMWFICLSDFDENAEILFSTCSLQEEKH